MTKESRRISQRFVWTPRSCAMASIQQTVSKRHIYNEKHCTGQGFFLYSFQHDFNSCYTTSVPQGGCLKAPGEDHLCRITVHVGPKYFFLLWNASVTKPWHFSCLRCLQYTGCKIWHLDSMKWYHILDIFDIFIIEWSVKKQIGPFFSSICYVYDVKFCVYFVLICTDSLTNCEKQLRTSINLFFFLFKYNYYHPNCHVMHC